MTESRFRHGFPDTEWLVAVAEVREFLVERARAGAPPFATIAEVGGAVTSLVRVDPYRPVSVPTIRRLLRDVDAAEVDRGNVRLSALAQEGDGRDLAWVGRTRRAGTYIASAETEWLDDVRVAIEFWAQHAEDS
jgi:hypothetical protein